LRRLLLAAAGAAWLLAALTVVHAGTASRSGLTVQIQEPDKGDLLSGRVLLSAQVSEPAGIQVREVTFVVNGSPISVDREPPFEALWDGVDTLRDHLIRVTAVGSDGERAYDLLSVPVLGPVTKVSVTGRSPEFVLLSVTFLDADGRPLTDVRKDEVLVLEDDDEQVVDVFAPDDRPLAAELLLDASQSTQPFWEKLGQASRLFAETLRTGDRAAVEAFNNASFPLAPFGSTPEEIETATSSFQDWGGVTRLYDALARGGLLLLGREETRRRAVVVLTDAVDFGSTLTAVDTDEYLRRGEVEVHAVLLQPGTQPPGFASQQQTLLGISSRTGGMHYIDSSLPMEEIFVRIGEQLRAQYLLGYYSISKVPPGKERRLEIRLRREGIHHVRFRRGHFGGETLGEYLAAEMSRGPERKRIVAVRAALLNRDPVAVAAMVQALGQGKDTTAGVPREARLALLAMGVEAVTPLKDALFPGARKRLRRPVAHVMVDLFARLVQGDDPQAVIQALALLGAGDTDRGREFLRGLDDEDISPARRERLAELLAEL
jgi:VWFA-related protein